MGDLIELSSALTAELERNAVVDPRSVPVRFSHLKHMSRSPLHYWDAVQLDRDDTMAMRLGRGAHAIVLGQPVVLYPGKQRRGKDFLLWKAQQDPLAEILIASEWAKATGMGRAIREHRIAAPLLYTGTVLEETIAWSWMDRACSSRPDARTTDGRIVIDLKTTQCAEPSKFERDAMFRGYHAQLAYYDQASEYETGRQADDLYVVAVESKRPYAVTVLRMTDEAREQGRRLNRLWFEQLLNCERANHWPSYVDAVVEFGVGDSGGELKLTIDGEEFDFDGEEGP